jgi:hypothetical protein
VNHGTNIFPAEDDPALAAVDIPNGMVPGCHLAIASFAFDDVHTVGRSMSAWNRLKRERHSHSVKQVSSAMLTVECLGPCKLQQRIVG